MATTRKKSSKPSRKPIDRPAIDLKAIETELNNDANAQAAFIKNPSSYLEDCGFKLRVADKAELRDLAKELRSGPKVPEGSGAGALGPRITIRISRRI